jgi:hypothetical protein
MVQPKQSDADPPLQSALCFQLGWHNASQRKTLSQCPFEGQSCIEDWNKGWIAWHNCYQIPKCAATEGNTIDCQ